MRPLSTSNRSVNSNGRPMSPTDFIIVNSGIVDIVYVAIVIKNKPGSQR